MTTSAFFPELKVPRVLRRSAAAYGWPVAIGLVSGLACVGVRLTFRVLQALLVHHAGLLPEAAAALSPWRRVATPIIGAILATVTVWAVRRWTRPCAFQEYIGAVRHGDGRICFASTFWRTLASAFSVATGAAIGREGSMIQFAAAVSSWLGERSPVRSLSLSRQVSYGAAAAVAAAYQAPIAGVFFAIEIVLGEWMWTEIPPLAIASTAGWLVSRAVLGPGPLFAVQGTLHWQASMLWAAPLALVLACAGPVYQYVLRHSRFAEGWPGALLWGGLAVGLISLLQPEVWGNGDVALKTTLQGNGGLQAVAVLLGLRLLATTICAGVGTVGGVFTPTLFAGSAMGLAAAYMVHASEPVLLAIAGMACFLAAVTHAPVMATFMAAELTGQYELLPWLFVLNMAANALAKRLSPHSLYGASMHATAGEWS